MFLRIEFKLAKDSSIEAVELNLVATLPKNIITGQVHFNTDKKNELYITCDTRLDSLSKNEYAELMSALQKKAFQTYCLHLPTDQIIEIFTEKVCISLHKIISRIANLHHEQKIQKQYVLNANTIDVQARNPIEVINEFEAKFPRTEIWRLFVDGHLYNKESGNGDPNGWKLYNERDPGCIASMVAAWHYCMDQVRKQSDSSISLDLIESLHKLCMNHNQKLSDESLDKIPTNTFRHFSFVPHCLHCYSIEGISNLLDAISSGKLKDAKIFIIESAKENSRDFSKFFISSFRGDQKTITNAQIKQYLDEIENDKVKSEDITQVNKDTQSKEEQDFANFHTNLAVHIGRCKATLAKKVTNANFYLLVSVFDEQHIKQINKKNVLSRLIYNAIANPNVVVDYMAPTEFDFPVKKQMQQIIDTYNQRINECRDIEEKIFCIGETIQSFERLHPYSDGNGRTFVNLLLNYMLISAGLPPALFYDPNVFDILDNVSLAIKSAIVNTLKVYAGEKALFGFPNLTSAASDEMESIIKQGMQLYIDHTERAEVASPKVNR